ncbi:MAG: LamG domain-containing protein, partial [Candidatus Aenigmatarchaeota archaeon]
MKNEGGSSRMKGDIGYRKTLLALVFAEMIVAVALVFAAPEPITSIILNSTSGTNLTTENLTVYVTPAANTTLKNIYDWYVNSVPFTVFNLPFEAGSNNTNTKDYSGNNYTCNITKAIWNATGGRDGFGAYEFRTVNKTFIKVLNTSSVSTNGSFSISMWIKSPDFASNPIIMQKYTGSTGFFFQTFSPGTLRFALYGSGTDVDIEASSAMSKNVWHHVAAVRQRNGIVIIYVDGTAVKNSSDSSGLNMENTMNFTIGGNDAGNGNYFNGTIDDVLFFNRALDREQILALNASRNDIVTSNITLGGDVWQACATPNDMSADGDRVCSESLIIAGGIENATLTKNPVNLYVQNESVAQFLINVTNTGTAGFIRAVLGDEWNISNLNYSGYSSAYSGIEFSNVSYDQGDGTGRVNWLVNLSAGNNFLLYVNFTPRALGNTTNIVDFANASGIAFTSSNGSIIIVYGANNPYVENVTLNSTTGNNLTSDNLTLYWNYGNVTGFTKYITNWYVNNVSFALFNLPFEAGSNSTYTKDYSGYNYTCNITKAIWNSTGGRDGFGAYEFRTVNKTFIKVLNTSSVSTNGSFSISMWIKSPDFASNPIIMQKYNGATGFFFQTFSPGTLRLGLYGSGTDVDIEASSAMSKNVWHHVAGVRQRNGIVIIYVDGTAVKNSSDSSGLNMENTMNFTIG